MQLITTPEPDSSARFMKNTTRARELVLVLVPLMRNQRVSRLNGCVTSFSLSSSRGSFTRDRATSSSSSSSPPPFFLGFFFFHPLPPKCTRSLCQPQAKLAKRGYEKFFHCNSRASCSFLHGENDTYRRLQNFRRFDLSVITMNRRR